MPANPGLNKADLPLRVCSYEDRPVGMDCLILMAESLCRVDSGISLHLTVPDAPPAVRAWAERRPEVILSTGRPQGVTGWDVKPWLLLRELDAGRPEALWLDTDMIVTRPISSMIREFSRDSLIVAQEWVGGDAIPMSHLWGMPAGRRLQSINACVVRATQKHRPLLERYLQLTQDQRYRAAQGLPVDRRPVHLLGDTPLLVALLESAEFSWVDYDYLRLDRHIAQCAGSSSYRAHNRALDLFRGLPPIIHGLGRKPWDPLPDGSAMQRFLLEFATDVSPYLLAARKVARDLDMTPEWLNSRTWLGAVLRGLTGGHPGIAGLPLAALHSLHMQTSDPTREIDKKV